MDDEGVPVRALLGEEDLLDSFRRERVRAETVHGLCREGYGAVRTKDLGGALQVLGKLRVETQGLRQSGHLSIIAAARS